MTRVRASNVRSPTRGKSLRLRGMVPPTLATLAIVLLVLLMFGPAVYGEVL